MRSKKWREKEFSTETLTQTEVDEIMEGSMGYDEGKAPVSRHTQYAESLDDMAELQKHRHENDELRRTHNYSALDAVREYGTKPAASADESASAKQAAQEDPSKLIKSAHEPLDMQQGERYEGENSDFYKELEDKGFERELLTPDDENYEDIMENYEEVMEKMSSDPTKPKYWFKEQGDHWYCSCGQLNKGDRCINCGLERDLLRALFFLHEPGEQPGRYEGMDIDYTNVDIPGGRLSAKAKILIAIAVILILLAAAGVFSYFYVIKPTMEQEAAANAQAVAASMEANVPLCSSDMSSFIRNSYITAGDELCKSSDFEDALSFYSMAQAINDNSAVQDKINSAKYGYVDAHKSEGGEKFEKYLNELYDANYPNIGTIYDEYYAWHFKVVANLDPEDYSTDVSTVSRSDTVYFHVSVSGGPPDESVNVYYEATWPSGAKQTERMGTDWKSGSKGYARFSYPVPILAKEGTLTFKIYDESTKELLGSDTVTFKK